MLHVNTPGNVINGIKDGGVGDPVAEPTTNAQHVPLAYLYASQGPEYALVGPNEMGAVFGADTFNVRKSFYTHQTALVEKTVAAGNTHLIKRIIPADAAIATMTLVADVDSSTGVLPKVLRDASGNYQRDIMGDVITDSGSVAGGLSITHRWVPTALVNTNVVTDVSANVKRYPIATFSATHFGAPGNKVAVRLNTADLNSSAPADDEIVDDQQALVYTASIVQLTETGAERFVTNLFAANSISFGFKPNQYDRKTKSDLTLNNLVDLYSDDGEVAKTSPKFGPLGTAEVHQVTVDALLEVMYSAESSARISDFLAGTYDDGSAEETAVNAYGTTQTTLSTATTSLSVAQATFDGSGKAQADIDLLAVAQAAFDAAQAAFTAAELTIVNQFDVTYGEDIQGMYLMNVFGGTYRNGNEYQAIRIKSAVDSAKLTEDHSLYLEGGSDGTMSAALFDAAVRDEINNNFENPDYPFTDRARFPFSCMYDTGFELDTKIDMFKLLNYRPDVSIVLSTQEVSQVPNSVSTEIANGITLKSAGALYGESGVHNTGVCRYVIMGHCGLLINSNYKGYLPLTIQLAKKRADYMGAGDGKYKSAFAYDDGRKGRNIVDIFKSVNNTYLGKTAKDAVWAAGINFVQHKDTHTLFIPAVQTGYAVKDSTLAAESTMLIATDLIKRSDIVWATLTGNSSLTDKEFLAESNGLFLSLIEGAYDNRAIVTVDSNQTPADVGRGWSWNQDIGLQTSPMRTTSVVNITNTRISEV